MKCRWGGCRAGLEVAKPFQKPWLLDSSHSFTSGVGARFLPALANPIYGTAAVGLDFNLFGPLGLFVEGNPRFEQGGNFGLGARAGLKFNF